MNTLYESSTLMQRRYIAVRQFMEQVKQLEGQYGVSRELLSHIQPLLIELALQQDLFPLEGFPIRPGTAGGLYEISVDPDCRFALYASVGLSGKYQPPHDHTTWAAIAGVHGDEHNTFFDRVDDRSVPGEGVLKYRSEVTVRPGSAVGLLGDDFHTIRVTGEGESLHLHLYGLSLDRLEGRIYFPNEEGGEYKRFMAIPTLYSPMVDAATLWAMSQDGDELAVIDVRETGAFAQSHLFHAANMPLSSFELTLPAGVPNRGTRIVLVDADGDSEANRAATLLRRGGYLNVAILRQGIQGWEIAGYPLYQGVHVPSKAFGEIVEHRYGTPAITAQQLHEQQTSGKRRVVVLDSRPMEEFQLMSIPEGLNCPGAELTARAAGLLTDGEPPLVVVNCAGRTRSILGAQSLINAGFPAEVYALENGTMGWHLAGLTLARGEQAEASAPDAATLEWARPAAAQVAERHEVPVIDLPTARAMLSNPSRTTYLLDVRLPSAYAKGHLPGARNAPGGQLIQQTDFFMPVRRARAILVDELGVQARMTAAWLKQMGCPEVYVLDASPDPEANKAQAAGQAVLGSPPEVPSMGAQALSQALSAGEAIVIDVDDSRVFRRASLPSSWFAVRSRLAECLGRLPADTQGKRLVFVSSDGSLARYAAADAEKLGHAVAYLEQGRKSWVAFGGITAPAGPGQLLTDTDDVWYRPYDRDSLVEEAMHEYLSWETGLLDRVQADTCARYILGLTEL